jgi:deoxycytidine triphosphate deaminase
VLSDTELRAAVAEGALELSRGDERVQDSEFRGCSIDLHLGSIYYKCRRSLMPFRRRRLDLARLEHDALTSAFQSKEARPDDPIRLRPREFVLAKTVEHVRLASTLAGLLTGRTGYARLGLGVEISQNLVQPGHSNRIPLQVVNHTPYDVCLYPGTPICQLVLFRLDVRADTPYDKDPRAKYRDESEFLSRAYRDDAIRLPRPQ